MDVGGLQARLFSPPSLHCGTGKLPIFDNSIVVVMAKKSVINVSERGDEQVDDGERVRGKSHGHALQVQ